jgi:hypothetical protein
MNCNFCSCVLLLQEKDNRYILIFKNIISLIPQQKAYIKGTSQPDAVHMIAIPALRRLDRKIIYSRPAWATLQDPVSKRKIKRYSHLKCLFFF